jgi:hypothetical protein
MSVLWALRNQGCECQGHSGALIPPELMLELGVQVGIHIINELTKCNAKHFKRERLKEVCL